MKHFKYLFLSLLFASTAFGQALPIRNDTPSNLRDLGANLNVGKNFSVDQKGRQLIGTITPGTAVDSLGKAEDTPHTTGDTGVAVWGVANTTASSTAATGDYIQLSTTTAGVVMSIPILDTSVGTNIRAINAEDTLSNTADAGLVMLGITQDPLSVDQSTSSDYGPLKMDRAGRTITTMAPASESWQSCGTATASTSDVAIKAAVASNRIYVTSITCKNTSTTVGPTLDFKDGSTIIAVGGITATSATGVLDAGFTATFPVPLRGTSATALNFATNTATSSVTCCAAGYISVN